MYLCRNSASKDTLNIFYETIMIKKKYLHTNFLSQSQPLEITPQRVYRRRGKATAMREYWTCLFEDYRRVQMKEFDDLFTKIFIGIVLVIGHAARFARLPG